MNLRVLVDAEFFRIKHTLDSISKLNRSYLWFPIDYQISYFPGLYCVPIIALYVIGSFPSFKWLVSYLFMSLFISEAGSHFLAQAGLDLIMLPSHHNLTAISCLKVSGCWNYWRATILQTCLVFIPNHQRSSPLAQEQWHLHKVTTVYHRSVWLQHRMLTLSWVMLVARAVKALKLCGLKVQISPCFTHLLCWMNHEI